MQPLCFRNSLGLRTNCALPRIGPADRSQPVVGAAELGRYLCEVRAGQYWRVENLKSFDEFLERRFPDSRRKAYYLMSIHEHLSWQIRRELKRIGWAKALELVKVARLDRQHFDCVVAQGSVPSQRAVQGRS